MLLRKYAQTFACKIVRYYQRGIVIILGNRDRRSNTFTTPGDQTDANLGSRETEFSAFISQKMYYKIPFVDLRLVNFPEKLIQNLFSPLKAT